MQNNFLKSKLKQQNMSFAHKHFSSNFKCGQKLSNMLILISFKNLAVDRMLKGNFLNIVGIIPHSTVCPNYLFGFIF